MSMSMDDSGGLVAQKKEREPRWDEKIKWHQFADDDTPYLYRLVGRGTYYAQHWMNARKKDGTAAGVYSLMCANYDSRTATYANNGCKVCEYWADLEKHVPYKEIPDEIKKIKRKVTLAQNAICREIQKAGPTASAQNWSPIVQLRLPSGAADTIVNKQDKFNNKNPLSSKDHGRDIHITYNSKAKEAAKTYSIDLGDPTPLKPEEVTYQPHLVDFIQYLKYPKESDVVDSLTRGGYYEYLNSALARKNLAQVFQQAPATQAATAQSGMSMMDSGPAITPQLDDSVPKAALSTQTPQPTAQPQAAAAQPVQQAPVAQASPTDPQAQIMAFAAKVGLTVVSKDSETFQNSDSMKKYRKGLNVPQCFSQYHQADLAICKTPCPVRLDCMMADTSN